MPKEEKSTMELVEECERKQYEEVLRRDPSDPSVPDLLTNAKTCADIRTNYDKTKNDKKRAIAEVWRPWLYAGAGMLGGAASFLFDPLVSKWKPFERFQERCNDLISRK